MTAAATPQEMWTAGMLHRYLDEKCRATVGVRRLHYWIVSLPEDERQIPSVKEAVATYQNTKYWYQRLSELLVNARLKELVSSDAIIDEKNGEPIYMPPREEGKYGIKPLVPEFGYLPSLDGGEEMPGFDDLEIRFRPESEEPKFQSQTHRIVVVIEKATSEQALSRLCKHYGADLLIFSGQSSVTRIYDVVTQARAEDKPIVVLYISDLDVAGHDMPVSFFRRLQEIYPHADHEMVRVALTRDQAVGLNLPPSFEPRGAATRISRFVEETGGDQCIELDALDEDDLIRFLRQELQKWCALEIDQENHREELDQLNDISDRLESEIVLADLREEYEDLRERHLAQLEKVNRVKEAIEVERSAIEREANRLRQVISERCEAAIVDAGCAVWVDEPKIWQWSP
ncbi:MAG: hypothetical protein WC277_03965 [Bacilli bacterium]